MAHSERRHVFFISKLVSDKIDFMYQIKLSISYQLSVSSSQVTGLRGSKTERLDHGLCKNWSTFPKHGSGKTVEGKSQRELPRPLLQGEGESSGNLPGCWRHRKMHNKKKEEKNHRSVQCNLLWLLQQLSAITILRRGSIWLFNSKGESMLRSVGNKHEPSMRQSLLLPRLTSNCSSFSTSHLLGLQACITTPGFYPVVGSEARTSHMVGKHAPNLSYFPGHEH